MTEQFEPAETDGTLDETVVDAADDSAEETVEVADAAEETAAETDQVDGDAEHLIVGQWSHRNAE